MALAVAWCATAPARAEAPKRFCAAARAHVDADARLSAAVAQVFGHPDYGVRSGQDAACTYPLKVLRYGTADVLLTIGNEPGQACHGCAATLSAYVLARAGGGLRLAKALIDFGQAGTFGDPGDISAVRLGPDDGLAIESGGTFQGHTLSTIDFYVFRGGGIVHIVAEPPIVLSASDAGAIVDATPVTEVKGSWTIVSDPNPSLRVSYRVAYGHRRSSSTAVWTLAGERWTLSGGRIPPEVKRQSE